MIRSLWIAKTGLDVQQTHLDTISNNLANGTTTGYKRVKPMFEDLIYQTIRQPGGPTTGDAQSPSGLQVGAGARVAATERIHIGSLHPRRKFNPELHGDTGNPGRLYDSTRHHDSARSK